MDTFLKIKNCEWARKSKESVFELLYYTVENAILYYSVLKILCNRDCIDNPNFTI